ICVSTGGCEDDLLVAPGDLHVDQLVSFVELDGTDPAFPDVLEFREAGPLDSPPFGHEDEESILREISSRNHRLDFLIRIEALQEVDNRLPSRVSPRRGKFESLPLEDLPFR